MDEPDDNISDERDQITKIMKKKNWRWINWANKKFEHRYITTNRKTINHEELEKSINEERYLKNKMDEFRMPTKNNRNDGDDNVNIDVVQGRSEVESEEKDQMNISKKNALASDTLDHGEECEEKKEKLVTQKI